MTEFLVEVKDNTELLNILNIIKPEEKQISTLKISQAEIKLYWEHASKTFQANLTFSPDMLLRFHCNDDKYEFGIDCDEFYQNISTFKGGNNLQIQLKSGETELLMRMIKDRLAVYIPMPLFQAPAYESMSKYMDNIIAEIKFQGYFLKMIIEEAKWTESSIAIYLKNSPKKLIISAEGERGNIESEIPISLLNSFEYNEKEEWLFSYSYELMKSGFCNIPLKKKINTKIEINQNGLLKISHFLTASLGSPYCLDNNCHIEEEDKKIKVVFFIVPQISDL